MPYQLYRRKGIWHYSLTIAGERERKSTRTADKKLAEDIAAKREWELRRAAVHGPEAVLTFGAAVDLYLDAGKSDRFILPLFERWEHTLVKSINEGAIHAAAKALHPKVGPATWNRQVVTPAQAVINHAASLGHCSLLRVRRFKAPRPIRRAVDRNWLDRFVAKAVPCLGALATFMMQTGARVGEATALQWESVSLQDATATFGKTKNGDPHVVHLTSELVAMLANLPKDRRKVFGYANRGSVYGPWDTACKRAGIPYVPTHQAGRHTFATEMIIRNKIDVATTAELGNWRTPRLLLDNYAHPENPRQTIEAVFGTPVTHGKRKRMK